MHVLLNKTSNSSHMSFFGGQLFHHLTPTPRFAAWSYLQHSEQPGFQSRPAASTTRGREHLDGHLEVATELRAFFFLSWNDCSVEHMKHGQKQYRERQPQQQEGQTQCLQMYSFKNLWSTFLMRDQQNVNLTASTRPASAFKRMSERHRW